MFGFPNRFVTFCLTLWTLSAASALADGPLPPLELSSLFSDHAVFQRDAPIRIWGSAQAGQHVEVRMNEATASVTADSQGRWLAELPAMRAGGPYTVTITGGRTIELVDVLIGDVWLCSGQSNMAFPVWSGPLGVSNASEEVAASSHPQIRLLTVTPSQSALPLEEADTSGWNVCGPNTVGPFSAVGYFFGRAIHAATGVPVGLIDSSYGGTAIEAWTSSTGLRTVPHMADYLNTFDSHPDILTRLKAAFDQEFDAWLRKLNTGDPGFGDDGTPLWAAPDLPVEDWRSMTMPQLWEDCGYPKLDGTAWFRRMVTIPPDWADKPLHIGLGPVSDRLQLWFNGIEIVPWATSAEPAHGYEIPASAVKEGQNLVAFRLYDMGGKGGLSGKPSDMWLESEAGGARLELSGEWLFKPGFAFVDFPPLPRMTPNHPDSTSHPTVLFNAMVAPLVRFPIRGAIWYQGEANTGRAEEYRDLLPALICDWRSAWNTGDWPFLIVQLANYMPVQEVPEDDAWAELREAQAMALSLPGTAMAVTIDIGEAGDIHPKNKQDVGKRLALAARKLAYGESIVAAGPTFRSFEMMGGKVRIAFDNVGGGLQVRGETLKGFAIAGSDRRFVWADAIVDGDRVVVWSDKVSQPVAVRYAWASNPDCNLCNVEGLPAAPFRTDDWPGITHGKRLTLPDMGALPMP